MKVFNLVMLKLPSMSESPNGLVILVLINTYDSDPPHSDSLLFHMLDPQFRDWSVRVDFPCLYTSCLLLFFCTQVTGVSVRQVQTRIREICVLTEAQKVKGKRKLPVPSKDSEINAQNFKLAFYLALWSNICHKSKTEPDFNFDVWKTGHMFKPNAFRSKPSKQPVFRRTRINSHILWPQQKLMVPLKPRSCLC